jgi:hypothetical protein
MQSADGFRRTLDSNTLAIVDALRAIISSARADLTEWIKWNAPGFAVSDDDRITLGIEHDGAVRLVLHRGAEKKKAPFAFEDPRDWRGGLPLIVAVFFTQVVLNRPTSPGPRQGWCSR